MRQTCLFVLLLLVTAGCDSGTKRPVVPVQGKISFKDGSALPDGTRLLFEPAEGGLGTASGKVGADGAFTLTHVSGSTGAAEGQYSVLVTAPEGNDPVAFYKLVPEKYASPGNLTAEVKQGVNLDLKITKSGRK